MNNRLLRFCLLPLLLLLLWPAAISGASANLLVNGDFEQATNGMPDNWSTEEWVKDNGITSYMLEPDDAAGGTQSAVIHNSGDNHARWIQTIKVESNKVYRISGHVKAEGLREDAFGAHLFVEGVAVYYPQVHDTDGQWVFLEFFGRTGKGQKEMTVGASVGGYGSTNAGKGWFDLLSVEQVKSAPKDASVFPLNATTVASAGDDAGTPHDVAIWQAMLIAVLFTFLFATVYAKLFKDVEWLNRHRSMAPVLVYGGFAIALALRIAIAVNHGGYANDVALFTFWSEQVVKQGIANFYHTDIFVDYPPGYIYVLYVLGVLKGWFGIEAGSVQAMLLYKLPAIAADLAGAAVIYNIARKKLSAAIATGLSFLYLFNPAVILDSAAWGQVDSVFALVLVIAITLISDKKFGAASIWYAIAALIKPQVFIFMPVLLLALMHGRKWRNVAVSASYGFGAFLVLAMPFFLSQGGIRALYDLYKGTLSSYPYATLNAFNLYALGNANWKPLTDKWLFMTFQSWGTLFIFAAVAAAVYFSVIRTKRSGEREDRSFFVAMVLISIVFLFVTKMHERYMFPIILLSLFAFIQMKDRRILHIFYGFTITNYINMSYVLDFSKSTTNVPMDGIVILCSIANIALFLYMIYIGYDHYKKRHSLPVVPVGAEQKLAADERTLAEFRQKEEGAADSTGFVGGDKKLSRKEWMWLGGITIAYALVALIGLGSFKAPTTVWQPAASGDSFYVDLGEVKTLERITSFGGVGTGKYKYEFALSPDSWGNELEVDSNHVAVFAWKSQAVNLEARYVKLTATQAGFSIHELGIYEAGSQEPLPIADIVLNGGREPRRGSVQALFDEQSLMVYNHNYMKGSYFDEIYHARTAYEHLEGIVAYESTHPPLGKIIIAIGIKLFGLSPFGWRIAGTLFGVAMLPLIYLMARRLFRKPVYAAIAAGLMAVDFMHFTQTRIATIDVYGVFFIMLMFYYMQKYASMSFYRAKLAATLVPLGLAGLFFGIGVASKWIVLYGGAGLAVMLALSLIERYKEYAAAKRMLRRGMWKSLQLSEQALGRIVKVFPAYTILTLAACIVLYIVIPLGIYALSYIPVLTVMTSGYTWKALIDYQINMFTYHSNLVSSHPFSSSWWEWPFMKRPVWYYSGGELPEGLKSTIAAMGNPLIWWTGIAAMLGTIAISIRRKDKHIYMLWIAFLSQYVPWMLVTRETFLYHYFAMVPFIILSLVYVFQTAEERMPKFYKLRALYIAAAAGLFILFYPALSGMTVPKWYVDTLLRWFPSWLF